VAENLCLHNLPTGWGRQMEARAEQALAGQSAILKLMAGVAA